MGAAKNFKEINVKDIMEDEFGISDFQLSENSIQLSSLCASQCSSKCSSNCGNKCASACSSKCSSACAGLCIGGGVSDAMDLSEVVSKIDIIL